MGCVDEVDDDPQVVAYVATNTVKEYIRTQIDPSMPKLGDVVTVNVNIGQNCNAFYP